MIELNKFQTDTYTFPLVLPNGEIDRDAKITVRSDQHPVVKKTDRDLLLESEQRRAVQKRKGRKSDDAMTEEDLEYFEEAMIKRLVSRVEKIEGISIDGKEIGSDATAIATALKQYDWIADQIGVQSKDISNFCRK